MDSEELYVFYFRWIDKQLITKKHGKIMLLQITQVYNFVLFFQCLAFDSLFSSYYYFFLKGCLEYSVAGPHWQSTLPFDEINKYFLAGKFKFSKNGCCCGHKIGWNLLILKTNASMIHNVVNIQFGFVDFVGLFRQRAEQPCWRAQQPHNFCLFVHCCCWSANMCSWTSRTIKIRCKGKLF